MSRDFTAPCGAVSPRTWEGVPRLRVPFGLAFGFVAGVSEAIANVAGPLLLVYFLLLGLAPMQMVQALNLCMGLREFGTPHAFSDHLQQHACAFGSQEGTERLAQFGNAAGVAPALCLQ